MGGKRRRKRYPRRRDLGKSNMNQAADEYRGRIHKYVIYYRKEINHSFNLIVQVCDDCISKFEAKYSDLPRSYGGILKSWSCCNFCGVVSLGTSEPELTEPEPLRGYEQLEFDFMKGLNVN